MQQRSYTQDDLKQLLKKVVIEKQALQLPEEIEDPIQQDLVHNDLIEENSIQANLVEEDLVQEDLIQEDLIQEDFVQKNSRPPEELSFTDQLPKQKETLAPVYKAPVITPPIEEKHVQEIAVLKTIIKQLHEKIKAKPTEDSPSLTATKEALEKAIERGQFLEEELQKAERTKSLLISQLRQQGAKTHEGDLLKAENERAKTATKELTAEIYRLQQLLKDKPSPVEPTVKIEPNFDLVEELKTQKIRLEQELAEQKQRVLRFMCDKKEVDEKLLALNNEKATSKACLRDLSQKNSSLAESQQRLTTKSQELSSALEEKNKCLAEKESLLHEKELALTEALEANQELTVKLETLEIQDKENQSLTEQLEKKEQELEETLEKNRLLISEHNVISLRFNEQQDHLKLLEQHLARRVKECALFSRQLEEEAAKQAALQKGQEEQFQTIASLQGLLEQAKTNEESLKKEYALQSKESQERFDSLEEKFESLLASWQTQGQELQLLKRLQTRFSEIEQLFGQFGQVLSQPIAPIETPIIAQKDFFNLSTPRVTRNLFE